MTDLDTIRALVEWTGDADARDAFSRLESRLVAPSVPSPDSKRLEWLANEGIRVLAARALGPMASLVDLNAVVPKMTPDQLRAAIDAGMAGKV